MPRESTLGGRDGENLVLDAIASKCFRALSSKRVAYRERELRRALPTCGVVDCFRNFTIPKFFRPFEMTSCADTYSESDHERAYRRHLSSILIANAQVARYGCAEVKHANV